MGTTVRLDGTTPVAKVKLWYEELKPLGSAPVGIAVNPEGMLVRPPAAAEVELAGVAAGAEELDEAADELEEAADEVTRVASWLAMLFGTTVRLDGTTPVAKVKLW